MYVEVIRKIQESKEITPREAAEMILQVSKLKFPIPIIEITTKMGFSIFSVEKLEDDASGVIGIDARLKEKYGNSKCVLINRNIKPGKRRFVLAHEIGHYLFDFNEREEFVYYNHYSKLTQDTVTVSEKRANEFAANLLMPEEEFILVYKTLIKDQIPLYELADKLADKFGVTVKAVRLRIKEILGDE